MENKGGSKMSTCSSPETLLHKLDSLDTRLQQLEEKQRLTQSYVLPDSHHLINPSTVNFDRQCKSLASALQEVHFKGTLMDRLRLLENRILQLNNELEKGNSAASSSTRTPDEIVWLAPEKRHDVLPSQGFNQPENPREELHRGFSELNGKNPKRQGPRGGIGEGEKKGNKRRNEKRPLDNQQIHRKWFAIGC
ncbi:uncharacterized protein LOC143847096 isoform X2 [Tasmannia lanceolata]|uniref:uncharacterized protein LOC143847096 isoform X2 n=1 Tax=Tasmannia lanceolata TaxID=3420 RepID=UPI0040647FD8